MKLHSLTYAAMLAMTAFFAVQCKNAEQDGPATRARGKQVTIMATLEQPVATKTSLSSERQVLWNVGDQIRVYNSNTPDGIIYTLTDGDGTTAGKFEGAPLIGDGPFYAIYPASVGGKLTESSIAITLPEEQKYADGSFGSGAAVSVAKADKIKKLNFKNVLGGIALKVTSGGPFSGVRVQTKGNEALNGAGTITFGDNSDPELSVTGTSDENSFLYLSCPAVAAPATFILMLPPGAFSSGFLVEFLDSEGNVMFRSAKAQGSNTVTRSNILDMPGTEYVATYGAAFFDSENFGYYKSIGVGQTPAPLTYDEDTGQYAFQNTTDSRRVRVQNLSQGFYADITTPKELTLGGTVQASITTLEGSTKTSATKQFKVLKKTGNKVWLVNDTDKVGIIQLMED